MDKVGEWFGHQFNSELTTIYKRATKLDQGSETAVHEIRKSCKKLRAMFKMASPAFGKKIRKHENKSFRKIARDLGTARDAAVQQALAISLYRQYVSAASMAGEARLRNWIVNRLPELEDHFGDKVQRKIYKEALFARKFPLSKLSLDSLLAGIGKQEKSELKARRMAQKDGSPELVHRWRKEAKFLYYQKSKIQGLDSEHVKPEEVETLKKLTDLLGDIHDYDVFVLAALEDGAPKEASALVPFALAQRHKLLGHKLLAQCGELL